MNKRPFPLSASTTSSWHSLGQVHTSVASMVSLELYQEKMTLFHLVVKKKKTNSENPHIREHRMRIMSISAFLQHSEPYCLYSFSKMRWVQVLCTAFLQSVLLFMWWGIAWSECCPRVKNSRGSAFFLSNLSNCILNPHFICKMGRYYFPSCKFSHLASGKCLCQNINHITTVNVLWSFCIMSASGLLD